MDDETASEVAALWGSAENQHYPVEDRLRCALAALQKMSTLVPGWDD
jgi:hypothetical protein